MERKPAKIVVMMGLILMVLVFVGTAIAQDKPSDNMQIIMEKMKADKKLLVAENMQLSEAEAKAFWPVYEKYQDELFLIRTRTAKLITDYAAAYDKMSNATAKKLLDESRKIEALRLKLGDDYLPKFRKVLPDTKVARYYQIENKLNAIVYYELASAIPLVKNEKQ
ncbi:MAG TPA: hypothetical protein DCR97_14315 [Deltaproteobacteria bacterium]|nr:hypothetical protein [Deltaproteobacteria bacterium]